MVRVARRRERVDVMTSSLCMSQNTRRTTVYFDSVIHRALRIRYRIRQGSYRVLYVVSDDDRTVTVVKIGHRRDV